jgi:glycosyltransferase involved in cell wall biosynthesis
MKPFFSIVIPTYNQGNLLSKCLESVLFQSFHDFEIIVIDNNSTDTTNKIIKKFKKKIIYKKIRNKGVIAKSRNLGIRIAKGKWIAFLDSDDIWKKKKLEFIHSKIKNNFFDVICNAEWYLKNNKKKLNLPGPFEKNFYENLITIGNRLSTSASVVKREFIEEKKILFNENKNFVTCEDYCFFLDIAREKGRFYFLKKALGYHQFHNQSLSSNLLKHIKAEKEVIKYHIFKLQNFTKNKKKLWRDSLQYRILKNVMISFFKNSKNVKSIINLLKIVTKNPIKFIKLFKFLFIKKINQFYYTFIESMGM